VACLTRGGRGIEEGTVAPELAARMTAIVCDVTDDASLSAALARAAQPDGP
jgi:hypothetical protein